MYRKTPCIKLIDEATLSENQFNRIYRQANNLKLIPSSVLQKSAAGAPPRDSGVNTLDYGPDTQWIFDAIQQKVLRGNREGEFRMKFNFIEPIQVMSMAKQQYTNWTSGVSGNKKRVLGFTLMLSDKSEYDGGDIEIEWGNPDDDDRVKHIKMNKGDLLIYPSDIWMRTAEITEGTRKTVQGWVQFADKSA
jgi:hypothetical protein